jgi:hypothetical protein
VVVAVVEEVGADEVEVLAQQGHWRAAESSCETRDEVRRRPETETCGHGVRASSEWCTGMRPHVWPI